MLDDFLTQTQIDEFESSYYEWLKELEENGEN